MGIYDVNGQLLSSDNVMAEDKNSIDLWEMGQWSSYNGISQAQPTKARTKDFIDDSIEKVITKDGAEVCVLAWDSKGNYIGFWNEVQGVYQKDSAKYCTYCDIALLRAKNSNYKFKLNYKNTTNVNIDSLDECKNIYLLTAGKMPFNERIYPSTVIVAAYNSSGVDKEIADYVCDGVNDEVEIQRALDTFALTSGTVILCNGDYNIDSLYDTGNAKLGKFGLYISKSSVNHSVIIKGMNHPNRIKTYGVGVAPTLRLSDTVYDALADDEKVTILGALPTDLTNPSRTYPNLNLTIENLAINVKGNQKAIIMVDGTYCSNMRIDYFMCSPDNETGNVYNGTGTYFKTTPNEGCIGIRTLLGQNFGTGYYINNCFIWGMYVAYDIGGEHLIAQNCGCRLCYYSFRFNGFGNPNANSHPNTLINCCEESCKASMYFCSASVKQSVNIIDYNMEIRNSEGAWGREKLAVEETPGSFCGNITFLANNEDYVNRGNIAFWEEGSGIDILTRNLAQKISGTTSQRPATPNLNQQYFDTTLKKMIVYIDGVWVDTNGTAV